MAELFRGAANKLKIWCFGAGWRSGGHKGELALLVMGSLGRLLGVAVERVPPGRWLCGLGGC